MITLLLVDLRDDTLDIQKFETDWQTGSTIRSIMELLIGLELTEEIN